MRALKVCEKLSNLNTEVEPMVLVGFIRIKDPQAFDQYRSLVGQTLEKYGGEVVLRGTVKRVLANEGRFAPPDAFVEIKFPSSEQAHSWFYGPEYGQIFGLRTRAMDLTLFTLK